MRTSRRFAPPLDTTDADDDDDDDEYINKEPQYDVRIQQGGRRGGGLLLLSSTALANGFQPTSSYNFNNRINNTNIWTKYRKEVKYDSDNESESDVSNTDSEYEYDDVDYVQKDEYINNEEDNGLKINDDKAVNHLLNVVDSAITADLLSSLDSFSLPHVRTPSSTSPISTTTPIEAVSALLNLPGINHINQKQKQLSIQSPPNKTNTINTKEEKEIDSSLSIKSPSLPSLDTSSINSPPPIVLASLHTAFQKSVQVSVANRLAEFDRSIRSAVSSPSTPAKDNHGHDRTTSLSPSSAHLLSSLQSNFATTTNSSLAYIQATKANLEQQYKQQLTDMKNRLQQHQIQLAAEREEKKRQAAAAAAAIEAERLRKLAEEEKKQKEEEAEKVKQQQLLLQLQQQRDQEAKNKAAQEPPPNVVELTASLSSAQIEFKPHLQLLQSLRVSAETYVSPNKLKLKIAINRSITQISRTIASCKEKSQQLIHLIQAAKANGNQAEYAFIMITLTEKLASQGETRVRLEHVSAFAFAAVAVNIALAEPNFSPLFLATLSEKCIYVLPVTFDRKNFSSLQEYKKAIGYQVVAVEGSNDTSLEEEQSYLDRMGAYCVLYCAYMQQEAPSHPHSISAAWIWLARILNSPIGSSTGTVLLSGLSILSFVLYQHYPRQMKKLLHAVKVNAMPMLKKLADKNPARKKYQKYIQDIL